MNAPSDGQRFLLTALFAVWVFAFGYGFVAIGSLARPNLMAFGGWQGMAAILAVAILGVSRAWPKGAAIRSLAVWPLVLGCLVFAMLIGWCSFVTG